MRGLDWDNYGLAAVLANALINVQPDWKPVGAPPHTTQLQRVLEETDCDNVPLFASDYPYWHYDGTDALPDGLPAGHLRYQDRLVLVSSG